MLWHDPITSITKQAVTQEDMYSITTIDGNNFSNSGTHKTNTNAGGKIVDIIFSPNSEDIAVGQQDAPVATGCLSWFTSVNNIRSANANKLVTPQLLHFHPYSLKFILGDGYNDIGHAEKGGDACKIVQGKYYHFDVAPQSYYLKNLPLSQVAAQQQQQPPQGATGDKTAIANMKNQPDNQYLLSTPSVFHLSSIPTAPSNNHIW